jgi:hypothetical protein
MQTKGQFIVMTVTEFAKWLTDTKVKRPINRIQNHHTLEPSYNDFNGGNYFDLLLGMKKWHVTHNGWSDIGQQLTIFPDGSVAVCRSFEKTPACIFGANQGCVCIENLGNFDKGRDTMRDAQRDAIIQVNALLCKKFGVHPDTEGIVYHHWFDLGTGKRLNGKGVTKTCPGTAFFGGNSVANCTANFIPLVKAALNQQGVVSLGQLKVQSPDGLLTIRDTPASAGQKLGELHNGAVVQIFEAKGLWRRIDPAQPRWVSSRFLVPA